MDGRIAKGETAMGFGVRNNKVEWATPGEMTILV